jgi:hypothetical protein
MLFAFAAVGKVALADAAAYCPGGGFCFVVDLLLVLGCPQLDVPGCFDRHFLGLHLHAGQDYVACGRFDIHLATGGDVRSVNSFHMDGLLTAAFTAADADADGYVFLKAFAILNLAAFLDVFAMPD